MAYISMTEPGIARGPHEHAEQADCFCFLGPSNFTVYLWDRRPGSSHSPAHQNRIQFRRSATPDLSPSAGAS